MSKGVRYAVVAVLAVVGGILVPSPAYLLAWLIWPDGVHSGANPTTEGARLLLIYGGGMLFWGWLAMRFLPRQRERMR